MPFRKLKGDLKQPGQHVYMFVPVEVCRRDTGIADFLNLRVPLALYFGQPEPAPCPPQKQFFWSACEFAVVIQKTGNGFPFGHRGPSLKFKCTPTPNPGAKRAASTPPAKRGAVGQQRSAGHNSVMKRLEDAAVLPHPSIPGHPR